MIFHVMLLHKPKPRTFSATEFGSECGVFHLMPVSSRPAELAAAEACSAPRGMLPTS